MSVYAVQMIDRLPLGDGIFSEFEFLSPEIALNSNRYSLASLTELSRQFQTFFYSNELATERRNLPYAFSDIERQKLTKLPCDEMWSKIYESTNFAGQHQFHNLGMLPQLVLS